MSAAPKKSLGQHFLSDRNILNSVADAIDIAKDDVVIEIGPGRGSLTEILAERAGRVIAVEIDEDLAESLHISMPAVEVRKADARTVTPGELLGGCVPYKLLGNLPYYAALAIVRMFLESDCRPTKVSVLVQLEVARNLCAKPGEMSLASLGVQLFGTPRIVRRVLPGAFNPPPKVTSAVVAIDVFDELPAGLTDAKSFFKIARAGFSAPRKQLRNALANGLGVPVQDAEAMLVGAALDPRRRAESLSVMEWARLSQV